MSPVRERSKGFYYKGEDADAKVKEYMKDMNVLHKFQAVPVRTAQGNVITVTWTVYKDDHNRICVHQHYFREGTSKPYSRSNYFPMYPNFWPEFMEFITKADKAVRVAHTELADA